MTSNVINQESLIDGIRRWVECESPSHDLSALNKMAALIEAEGKSLGLMVELVDLGDATGAAILMRQKDTQASSPGVLVLGHYDTVHPIGALSDNPCRLEHGRLYGPGSYDMKAGLYLCMRAMAVLREISSTALPYTFLIVPDEETGSHASRALTEELAATAKYALAAEPARAKTGFCVTSRKGTGHITVSAHGCAAHAGVAHERGRSAVRELAHQILKLESLTDYSSGTTVSVGYIEGGGPATNVVPDSAKLIADYRIATSTADVAFKKEIERLCSHDADVRLEAQAVLNRPPMARTTATGELLHVAQDIARKSGWNLDEAPTTGGGSDANFTAALGVPTLDGLGADGDGAHTKSEYIEVGTLVRRAEFWIEILKKLA